MARRIRIGNPFLGSGEKSSLTSDYTSGTTLNIVNSFAFSAGNFAVIGEPGKDEKIESKLISAVPSGGLTLTLASALDYDYLKDTVVYQSRYDQVQIESRANSSSSWAIITTSGIQWDKLQTLYTDNNGIATTQYRWRFYNSSTGTTSEYSPTLTGAGFTPDQAGFLLREIRLLTGDLDGRVMKDREILRAIERGLEIVKGRLPRAWWWKFEDSTITTTANVNKYNLDTLESATAGSPTLILDALDTVRYRFNNGQVDNTYPLNFKSDLEFYDLNRDGNALANDDAMVYTILGPDTNSVNGYIQILPTTKTTGVGTLFITGYKVNPTINTVDDKVVIPLPHILIDYGIAQLERVRGNDAKAAYYEDLFFGPPPDQKDRRRLTGIALLEQLNDRQRRPEGQPRSLMNFKGRRFMRRVFGNPRPMDRDYLVEKYW